MSKREDEGWSLQRDNLKYCRTHSHYYRADIGCQLCGYDKLKGGDPEYKPELKTCPWCIKVSLFLNLNNNLYECLNHDCKKTFQLEEID